MKHSSFLLINPPVYDFAAFDLWSKPLGLLYLAAILADAGAGVQLIDCMDRHFPGLPPAESDAWGCGPYLHREIPKPESIASVPRKYKRYGIPEELFAAELARARQPDAVLITSGMTYWYPGVTEAVRAVKRQWPRVPVILGGTYATLCPGHAHNVSGADHVLPGSTFTGLWQLLEGLKLLPTHGLPVDFASFPAPGFNAYARPEYVSLRTSLGCPFRCSYCAIELLSPGPWQKKPAGIMADEMAVFISQGIHNIAFYDDGLLAQAQAHIIPLLSTLCERGITANFHSPNGLHARFITPDLASLMNHARFIMPRLSLETASEKRQNMTGGKIYNEEFAAACRYLAEAGYRPGEYAAYLLLGMPGQALAEVEQGIRFAHGLGCKVLLAEYSAIPGTKDWDIASCLLPSDDPLWHNNSLFGLFRPEQWREIQALKDLSRTLNRGFAAFV